MHRFYVFTFIVTLALALASCQGMGKFLPGIGGGSGSLPGKQVSVPTTMGEYDVWPVLGYDTGNARAGFHYAGPTEANPDIDLLWKAPIVEGQSCPAIYSSPVVHIGRGVVGPPGQQVEGFWEDIFVVDKNGVLYGLDGWDSALGHQIEGEVFGWTDTHVDPIFVAASAATQGEFGPLETIPGGTSGNYNTIVFYDGNARLRFFASNGKDDGIKDPRWPQAEGLTEFLWDPGSPQFDIGGDYAVSSVVLGDFGGFDHVFAGSYDSTESQPGRLYRIEIERTTIGDDDYLSVASFWQTGGAMGVPLQIGTEGFNVESSIAIRPIRVPGAYPYSMDDECYVVGRSQSHPNTARLFVHDNTDNGNGQELAHSAEFLWFDEVNPSQGRGRISSPVIDHYEDGHDDELVYLATPHEHQHEPGVFPGDPEYDGDVIRRFRYMSDAQPPVLTELAPPYTMNELQESALLVNHDTTCLYVAGTPALVEGETPAEPGTLVFVVNHDHGLDGFEGWQLLACDMRLASDDPQFRPCPLLVAWSQFISPGRCDTSPAIDSEGNVWVAANSGLYLFEGFINRGADQAPTWRSDDVDLQFQFHGRIWSSPSIGYPAENDIHHKVYVADDAGWVYAFADDVDALEPTHAWPLQGHDERHSYQSAFPGPLSAGSSSPGTLMGNGSFVHDIPVAEPVLSPRGAHVYVMNRSDTLNAMSTADPINCEWYVDRYGGEYQPPGPVYNFSAPAVAANGTVYAMHTDGYLQAYTDQGNSAVPNWPPIDAEHQPGFPIEEPTGNSYAAPVAIERGIEPVVSNVVYVGTWSGNICAVKDAGSAGAYWWSGDPPSSQVISVGAGCQIVGAPAVHPNGDIFFVALEDIHEDPENPGHWLCDARVGFIEEQQVQPHVYYATHDSSKDKVIEDLDYYRCMEMRPQPVIGDNERIIVALPDWLHVYELINGVLVDIQDPATAPEAGYCFSSTPALDFSGSIYVAQTLKPDGYNPRPSFVCRYTPDGIPQWSAPNRPTSDHEAFAAVTLDSSACLYWSTREQVKAYVIGMQSAPFFSAPYGARHLTSPVIADDGTAFVANLDNTIYKIGTSGT